MTKTTAGILFFKSKLEMISNHIYLNLLIIDNWSKTINAKFIIAKHIHLGKKGSNENMNGRLRWHLPKDADIAKITKEDLDQLAAKMNRCPRKCLGFKTPQELFFQQYKNDWLYPK